MLIYEEEVVNFRIRLARSFCEGRDHAVEHIRARLWSWPELVRDQLQVCLRLRPNIE